MSQTLSELQVKVQKAILDDAHLGSHTIQVQEENGIITLRGAVASREAREMAEQIAREVFGVRGAINELEISADV